MSTDTVFYPGRFTSCVTTDIQTTRYLNKFKRSHSWQTREMNGMNHWHIHGSQNQQWQCFLFLFLCLFLSLFLCPLLFLFLWAGSMAALKPPTVSFHASRIRLEARNVRMPYTGHRKEIRLLTRSVIAIEMHNIVPYLHVVHIPTVASFIANGSVVAI